MQLFSFLKIRFLNFVSQIGEFSILIWRLIRALPLVVKNPHLTTQQMLVMGVNSLPLVVLTSIFIGAVSAIQTAYQLKRYMPMKFLGITVGKAVIIELGPVLTALVVAGRVGASIAAEIGSMKVTEQIDALETMALDPVRYLVVPRFFAGITMLPVLTIFANFIAIMGGLAVAVLAVNVPAGDFINTLKEYFRLHELFDGLAKALVFGGIITTIGCFQGFRATGGAEGVGFCTTKAVVLSSILILVSDYVLASIFFI